jgi:hypothetical protein
VSPSAEQAALAKLTANWRSVIEDAVTTTAERQAKRTECIRGFDFTRGWLRDGSFGGKNDKNKSPVG